MSEIDHSLKRLGTDYVDLYQIHRRDQLTPWEETLEALHDLVKEGKVRYLGASSMKAWEFGKALHLQKANGWARFVSLQDTYNLLTREEERERCCRSVPMKAVQTIVYSPLARGRLARRWGETTARSKAGAPTGHNDETNAESDQKIVEAVGAVAKERGVSQATVALAWLRSKCVVAAPIVGALKTKHIDDAITALAVALTNEEVARLEATYTPRLDYQGVSDPAMLACAVETATGFKASTAQSVLNRAAAGRPGPRFLDRIQEQPYYGTRRQNKRGYMQELIAAHQCPHCSEARAIRQAVGQQSAIAGLRRSLRAAADLTRLHFARSGYRTRTRFHIWKCAEPDPFDQERSSNESLDKSISSCWAAGDEKPFHGGFANGV